MSLKEEIVNAIGAHGLWKTRLRAAISSRSLKESVAEIRAADQCAFGRWLAAAIEQPEMQTSHAKAVRKLHAEFHIAAARVAELALAGKSRQAESMLTEDGEYGKVSSQLTLAMMAWKADASRSSAA